MPRSCAYRDDEKIALGGAGLGTRTANRKGGLRREPSRGLYVRA